MPDVFVSYSRSDTEFVSRLAEDLRGRGQDVWMDVDGIRDAERFPEALKRAIEGSDAFLFVISPDAVSSKFCGQEVTHAAELNKRIVPVAFKPVPDEEIPDEIRFRNWIPVESEAPPIDRVMTAIETDLEWEQEHTRLTVRALEWEAAGRDRSILVRGSELAAAERWLTNGADKERGPTALEQEFIFAGRAAASRRQRTLMAAIGAVAVVAVGLLVFALISRGQAVRAETQARAQALAGFSEAQIAIDPERAVLLGIHAVQTKPTQQAMFALRAALDTSAIRLRLRGAARQSCTLPGYSANLPLQIGGPGVAYSADGRRIAEGLCSGEVRLIDAASGRIERTLRLPAPAIQLIYARSGALVVLAGGRFVALDPASGAVVARGPRVIGLTQLTASPRAPVVAAAAPGAVVMWNPASGEVRRLALPSAPGSEASAIAFSPDGGRVAVSVAFAQPPGAPPVMLLDARSGRVLGRVAPAFNGGGPAIQGLTLAFSPDGRTLVVGEYTDTGGGRIVLRDATAPDLRVERRLFSLTLPVDAVAFSPDGTRIAYGNSDGSGGLMTVGGQPVVRYPGVTSAVNAVAFSPDGRLVLETAQSGDVLVWRAGDLTLGSVKIPGVARSVQAAPAGSGFVTASIVPAGLVARLWNAGGTPAAPPLVISPTQQVGFFAFSSTQNVGYFRRTGFVAVNARATSPTEKLPLRLWDVAARRVVQTLPQWPLTIDASILPGGSTIAQWTPSNAAATAFTFELLDTHTGHEQTLDHTSSGCAPKGASADIAADAAATLVAYATPCVTRVWDRRTGRWAGPPIRAAEASAVALTPDGRQIAVALGDYSVAVYEVATGRQVARLTDPTGTVLLVAFSPNGRYFAVAGQESAIRIYDAHRYNDLRVITTPAPINGTVFFTPDSHNVIGWSQVDSVVREYDACTDCQNRSALVALAKTRVTRALTGQERREFGVG